jgi:hypothetical protein
MHVDGVGITTIHLPSPDQGSIEGCAKKRLPVMSTPRTPPAEQCSLAQQAGQSDPQVHVTELGEQRQLGLS